MSGPGFETCRTGCSRCRPEGNCELDGVLGSKHRSSADMQGGIELVSHSLIADSICVATTTRRECLFGRLQPIGIGGLSSPIDMFPVVTLPGLVLLGWRLDLAGRCDQSGPRDVWQSGRP